MVVGKDRPLRALLWKVPLGLCTLLVVAFLAVSWMFRDVSLDFGVEGFTSTSPDCVHDESPQLQESRDGDLRQVRALVNQGADLDLEDANGNTALYCASFKGHADVVELLIAAGADIDHRNASGEAALHWASGHGDLAVVGALLDAGAKPDVITDRGHTPLLWATLGGEARVVDALLAYGADPNAEGVAHPLEVMAYLGAPPDPPRASSPARETSIPQCLSPSGAGAVTPLEVAVARERSDLASALLLAGAEHGDSVYGCTSLQVASWLCNGDLVALLLLGGASLQVDDPDTPTPVEVNASDDCAETARLLHSATAAGDTG